MQTHTPARYPTGLLILDGWGLRQEREQNAIQLAHTPHWDRLIANNPHTQLTSHGEAVGLPAGQMGNSEVGHLNIGAGRVVFQDLTRIGAAIGNGEFFANTTMNRVIDRSINQGTAIHLLTLVSDGGVHAHIDHLIAFCKLCNQKDFRRLNIHVFTDGRDVPPKSALSYIQCLEDGISEYSGVRIASVIGRYYAMDRDSRWERTEKAYRLINNAEADYHADSAAQAIEMGYARGETDEFLKPTLIDSEVGSNGAFSVGIEKDDNVLCLNFRSDRMRQITRAFIDDTFSEFERVNADYFSRFATLTSYHKDFDVEVAFEPQNLNNVFGEVLSKHNITQLRIAETEKYPHVSFFFNGGIEKPFEGEDRILIPSPKVATYDLQPEMSVTEVCDRLVESITTHQHQVFICNFANPDMVGHTGDLDATIKAIEAVDIALGRVVEAVEKVQGNLLVTADHGNAEILYDPVKQQPHTAHTTNPVALIYVGEQQVKLQAGNLCDIAPTLLQLLDIAPPHDMTGKNLLSVSQVAEEPSLASVV